jgi:F-type H+-transporting ATPase subunit gamma
MANLKEIRSRISSVNSTKQITSAMKMVSASKLKRAQRKIEQMRPYSEKLSKIIQNVSSNVGETESVYANETENKKILFVPISSNRGLCGAFNANVLKKVHHLIIEDYAHAEISVYGIGKKGIDGMKGKYKDNLETLQESPSNVYDDLNFENVSSIAESIMAAYREGKFDKVILVYNSFKNAASQIIKDEQFLPIKMSAEEDASTIDYIFEPVESEILEDIIPNSLKVQLFKAILDSNAAEHGARMTAMHKATDNAEELLKDLKLTYNKLRQASITNEILEIVSGAEALAG